MTDKKQQSLLAFNKQAASYDSTIFSKHARALYPFILNIIIQQYGHDILDLGCGTGELIKQVLMEDPKKCCTGIDLSEKMLEEAHKKCGNSVNLLKADAQFLPFDDNSFDLVYCNDSFHHYPFPKEVLKEVHRVLRYGGCFIMGDCYQTFISRKIMNLFMSFSREGDVKIYSEKEMCSLLGEEFHAIRWVRVNTKSFIAMGTK